MPGRGDRPVVARHRSVRDGPTRKGDQRSIVSAAVIARCFNIACSAFASAARSAGVASRAHVLLQTSCQYGEFGQAEGGSDAFQRMGDATGLLRGVVGVAIEQRENQAAVPPCSVKSCFRSLM